MSKLFYLSEIIEFAITKEEESLIDSFRVHLDTLEQLMNKGMSRIKDELKCKIDK